MRSLAVLDEWEGDTRRATNYLQEALSLVEQIGLPGEQWQILAKLGELFHAIGEEVQARHALGQAVGIIQALAARIGDKKLKDSFLKSDTVQYIIGV